MEKCVFCEIVSKKKRAYRIFEDEQALAFLDINPIRQGHVLLTTKEHYPYIFALNEELFVSMFKKARLLSHYLEKALNADRIGIMVSGVAIPHAHIHLVPVYEKKDLDPCHAKPAAPHELAVLQKIIREAMR